MNIIDNNSVIMQKRIPQLGSYPTSFCGIKNIAAKPGALLNVFNIEKQEQGLVSQVSRIYDEVIQKFSLFNGVQVLRYKSLYPGLAAGTKTKGFLFSDVLSDNKKIQVVKYKYLKDEELTLNILDKDNNFLKRFLIKKSGDVELKTNNLSSDEVINTEEFKNCIRCLYNEMEDFKLFCGNLKAISHRFSAGSTKKAIFDFIKSLIKVKESKGIQNIINDTVKAAETLDCTLYLKQGKDMFELKKMFFEDFSEDSAKTKGFIFKNVKDFGETLSFCPLKSKDDSRKFRLFVFDKNMNLKKTFVAFDDGKVAKLKSKDKPKDLRPNNLEFISDDEIQQSGIRSYCEFLQKEFKRFEDFIISYRREKKEKIIASKTKLKSETKPKSQPKRELKPKPVKRFSAKKDNETLTTNVSPKKAKDDKPSLIQTLQNRKIDLPKASEINNVDVKINTEKNNVTLKSIPKVQSNKVVIASKPVTDEVKTDIIKSDQMQQTNYNTAKILTMSTKLVKQNFSDINLSNLISSLNNLFNIPVSERSPHLIHEKMSNGKIFSGRIHLSASDGVKLTLSRVKSPKYVEFTYYSIKLDKDGKSYFVNIDPSIGRIIDSTPDGKPVISNSVKIKYISKDEILKRFPQIASLPKYLAEVFEQRSDAKRVFIDTALKQKVVKKIKTPDEMISEELYKIGGSEIFDF